MNTSVRTLTGDIAVSNLGVTNSHDHLFLSTPALPGEELNHTGKARAVMSTFAASGGRTVVQWSPAGTSRKLGALAELSRTTGVNVVAATGRHRQHVYERTSKIADEDEDALATRFTTDITTRRCGLIKVGVGAEGVSPFERASLNAAATASRTTGCPIAVHLEGGAQAIVVVELLADLGVAASSVVLGHMGRHRDLSAIRDAAATGAWLCLDLPSDVHGTTEDGLIQRLVALGSDSRIDQLLIGADTTTASARASGHDAAAVLTFTATAEHALGSDLVHRIIVDNPARAWAF